LFFLEFGEGFGGVVAHEAVAVVEGAVERLPGGGISDLPQRPDDSGADARFLLAIDLLVFGGGRRTRVDDETGRVHLGQRIVVVSHDILQWIDGAAVADLSQRIGRCGLEVEVLGFQAVLNQRIHGLRGGHLAQSNDDGSFLLDLGQLEFVGKEVVFGFHNEAGIVSGGFHARQQRDQGGHGGAVAEFAEGFGGGAADKAVVIM